jgi:hypothetical protein
MLPYRDSRLTRIALVIFFVLVIAYAYYEAHGLLFGPTIDIPSQTMTATDSAYILIHGQANRISSLAVDGNPIQVTETGAFDEPYVLAPGVNRIVFDAKDKYGNNTQKIVEIVYTPTTDSTASTASTSSLRASSPQARSLQATTTQATSSREIAPTGSTTGPIAPGR